jgi:uncharacterized protein (DUF58 family)
MRSLLRRKLAAWILARQGADRFPVTFGRRRLYVVPTRAGIGFGALLLSMLVAALNYGNSLALLVTCLLGGLALVAMHQCHRNLLDLALKSAWTDPAFAGGQGRLALILANDTRLDRYRLEIDASAGDTATIDLPGSSTRQMELPIPAPKRGLVRIDRVRVSTTYPFGLFRAWTWIHAPLALTVYPRPRGSRPVPALAGIERGHCASQGVDRDEWRGLRAFREGDSPRQVAWKAYARGAPLLVKEYTAGISTRRLFDFAALAGLDTEARLEQLARWIVDAEQSADSYGLVLGGKRLPPQRGPEHCRRALTALALYGVSAP